MAESAIIFKANFAFKLALVAVSDRVLLSLHHVSEHQQKLIFLQADNLVTDPIRVDLIDLLLSHVGVFLPIFDRSFCQQIFDCVDVEPVFAMLLNRVNPLVEVHFFVILTCTPISSCLSNSSVARKSFLTTFELTCSVLYFIRWHRLDFIGISTSDDLTASAAMSTHLLYR